MRAVAGQDAAAAGYSAGRVRLRVVEPEPAGGPPVETEPVQVAQVPPAELAGEKPVPSAPGHWAPGWVAGREARHAAAARVAQSAFLLPA